MQLNLDGFCEFFSISIDFSSTNILKLGLSTVFNGFLYDMGLRKYYMGYIPVY
jgi:hypothetical protein